MIRPIKDVKISCDIPKGTFNIKSLWDFTKFIFPYWKTWTFVIVAAMVTSSLIAYQAIITKNIIDWW